MCFIKSNVMLLSVCAFFIAIALIGDGDAARVRKQGPKQYKNYNHLMQQQRSTSVISNNNISTNNFGLWPSVFNLATKALITVNATCGEGGREEFCRMVEGGKGRCGICDNFSTDPGKKHPISYAIDGTNKWWQSPALFYGDEYEYVTVTIDLKQVYQIAHVIIKAANSPRPGTWVLERSLDDETYEPWQYFARNDKECLERFGVIATKGKPHYFTDSEVICTAFYSRLTPMENGEIHTSLVHGRPGANERSPELLEFTKARYVRLRLMGLRGAAEPLPRWFSQDAAKDKRLFYTIRDINIGGQCVCNGHAENCRHNVASGHPECECGHHTSGPNCEKCSAMFNQRQWGPGTSRDARQCLPCNCHGHATSCHYDEAVDKAGLSVDISGNYQGGGVCDNCTAHTTGINCERCMPGFYRPSGVAPDAERSCFKCECDPASGSSGMCVQEGELAGGCECLPGYAGERCEMCASGFRGWPKCEACPCDAKGTARMEDCEGECLCKANVEGKFCERCKSGFFALSEDNPDGCSPCFCSEVTTICEAVHLKPQPVQTLKDWLITDLQITQVVKPTSDDKGLFSIGNYELPEVESLYWLAPQPYLGNKLEYYSSEFTFKEQWVIMRGDTSGRPTTGPNIIIVGANGLKIAHGNDFFSESKATFSVKLQEDAWYHFPTEVNDIVTRLKRTQYVGDPVNRRQFLNVLADVKYILLRATFHTDQVEALLEEAVMNSNHPLSHQVEKCACPSGYTGLSCESCAFGHVRIITNSTSIPSFANGIFAGAGQGFCGKCDCNGHSETCNPDTGECFCQHNTVGETCERCKPGYYGNPLKGTPEDCKRCACPRESDDNNFSPSCQVDYFASEDGGYVCTQCPKGYTGDHCEICDDGFFGDPTELGNSCKRCNCNGGPCDRLTGQCLGCKGNTEGWRCERCKPGYYGDASTSNCQSCQCDPIGALSKDCNNITGQCECKERFTGLTCEQCQTGYGNVTALCTPCACNPTGSKSDVCDPQTGLCDCRKGVEGFHCDACQNLHYGFSENGCEHCNCDPDGSQFPTCDLSKGVCRCKPHYAGAKCDVCEDNYWKDNKHCVPCNCNKNGSESQKCQQDNGYCACKQGVGGPKCNICKDHHYGNVLTGCKECDPCDKAGHICDQQTGRCVCPPLTSVPNCEKCDINAWGYEPGIGCKACNCSRSGSTKLQCDYQGRCTCKIGYEGEKCDRCDMHKFYGYPNCRECQCDLAGTDPGECNNGSCRCTNKGCSCKPNVHGKRCDSCKPGTFSLDAANPDGCTKCFCFGRSANCTRSSFKWDLVRTNKFADELCPNNKLCRTLPPKFLGDLTPSIGGLLRIKSHQNAPQHVFITGNGVVIIAKVKNDVKMMEYNWNVYIDRYSHLPASLCRNELTRNCFMTVLQNVTKIQIEQLPSVKSQDFEEVVLDKAADNPQLSLQSLIEQCECPKEYSSSSCQDPSDGYYRYYPSHAENNNFIDRMIGVAKKCECNGRSKTCHKETGRCLNCTHFTKGDHCELCADGFFKDRAGNCSPCLCPSESQNFARSCRLVGKYHFECDCKDGYSGKKCDQCANEYWGNPHEQDGLCQLCNCNPHGSTSRVCNKKTGICECKPGFTGKQCSQCLSSREVIQNGVCTPCDECTQILFNKIDLLSSDLNKTLDLFEDGIGPPWPILNETLYHVNFLTNEFDTTMKKANELINKAKLPELEHQVQRMKKDLNLNSKQLESHKQPIKTLEIESNKAKVDVEEISRKIDEIMKNLNNFGNSQVDADQALRQAKQILEEIKERTKSLKNNEDVFKACQKLSDDIDIIYADKNINPAEIKSRLNDLKQRLSSLNVILAQTETVNKLTKNKNKQNAARIAQLSDTIARLNERTSSTNEEVMEIMQTLNTTNSVLEDIHKIYVNLSKISNFDGGNKLSSDEDNENSYEIIASVAEHVKDLQDKVKYYNSLVNFTKEEWQKINGSGAYDNLVKGIKEANETAYQARNLTVQTLNLINPAGNDSLIDATNVAKAFSDRLEKRVINLKNLTKQIKLLHDELEQLHYDIKYNGRDNNDLIATLHNMKQQIQKQSSSFDDLYKVIERARDVTENMASIEQKIKESMKRSDLFKIYHKFINLTSNNEIENLLDKISLTRIELENLNVDTTLMDKIKKINDQSIETKDHSINDLKNKMDSLKNKIQAAREAAQSITIGISLIENCKRIFKVRQDIFFSLKIIYKCLSNCTLFDLMNSQEKLKIVVEQNVLKIFWKNNPVIKLDSSSEMNTLSLVKTTDGSFLIRLKDKEETIVDHDLFRIRGSKFAISGKGKEGDNCLKSLEINDKAVGLWEFESTEGRCPGCLLDALSEQGNQGNQVFFQGIGYKNVTAIRRVNAREFDLTFTFSTFDENSVIFLAKDEKSQTCSYLFLGMKKGRVFFKILHTDGTNVTLQTKNKYNNGLSTTVIVQMQFTQNHQQYKLQIRDKNDGDETMRPLEKKNLFKIFISETFIGGILVTFDKTCIEEDTTPFLGYLTGNKEYDNNPNIKSYGIKQVSGDLKFYNAWFSGRGHLSLKLEKKLTPPYHISFILKTLVTEKNAFIMNFNNFLDVFIKDRKLSARIAGSKNIVQTLHDLQQVEMVLIYVFKNEIVLSVNKVNVTLQDASISSQTPPDFTEIYIGHDRNDEHPYLSGGIGQISTSKEKDWIKLDAKTVQEFSDVQIGRDRVLPEPVSISAKNLPIGSFFENNSMREMQNTEGCPLIGPYETDPEAVKFGDKPNSFIYVENNFWKRDYVLQFKFRVFYPNGLLFIAIGSNQQRHFTILDVFEGKLRLRIKGKRMKKMDLPDKINDGEWHTVQISQNGVKRKRKIGIILDGRINRSMKMPKNNVKGEIYFGGIPDTFPDFLDFKNQLYQFRGCMSSLKINNSPQVLVKNKKNVIYNNIGQCFRNVERGAYFGGDAFAIYKGDFKVNKILELSFEFRTVEQNGILLSVSNFGNSPALSVELQNGAVVMTIDMGNGAISNVTNSLDSDFTLCNNRWHNITALYSSSELTVNVDGIRKSWVQSDVNSLMDEIEAPLYIGGLPDNAPSGTLKIKENFKGCIRNLKIEENIMDWTDMKELNNVLLNACPVQTN